ncbi:MAG: electron transfer flavoprotein subunit alpha/FixB family protein [Limnochordaceae bacterium]|nr:electron transfer flavoprotein subunit alpha/FixB family protein [Limnochordaceae bacterium]
MSVVAIVLAPEGTPGSGVDELMGCAVEAARATGGELLALVLAGTERTALAPTAERLWRLGARRVFAAADPALRDSDAGALVAALAGLVPETGASVAVLDGDPLGAQVGPRLAMRLGAASVTEVVEVRGVDGQVLWVRPIYGGKAMAAVRARRPRTVAVVRPRAFRAPAAMQEGPVPADAVVHLSLPAGALGGARPRVVERRAGSSEGQKLEDARVIVSGGRGVGGPEGFEALRRLAEVLGGAVGASRAAVDAGWAPAHLQIGQTGKIVAPDLYVAVGISGASQHLAGVSGARHVVAINKDPEAPIFRAAELGLVEDYRRVLPLLTDRLAQALGRGGDAARAS